MRFDHRRITIDKLILLIIEAAKGRLRGKTLLQKQTYFLAKLINLDLSYRAHYYGPYSTEVERGLAHLKALGFIAEETIGFGIVNRGGFEVRRFDYILTEDARKIIQRFEREHSDECLRAREAIQTLRQAGNVDDYISLSVAAKVHYILKEQNTPMTNDAIRGTAKALGWDIEADAMESALSFLLKLGLADE